MKDRYRHLAEWKKRGFDRMPTRPLPLANAEEEEAYIEQLIEHLENCSDQEMAESDKKEIRSHYREHPYLSWEKASKEMLLSRALPFGLHVLKIQGKYYHKEITYDEAVQRLADAFLKPAQGGAFITNKEGSEIQKAVYDEMVNCIKEIKIKADMAYTEGDSISEFVEGIESLFEDSELSDISKAIFAFLDEDERFSASKLALKIMHKRLKGLRNCPSSPERLRKAIYRSK